MFFNRSYYLTQVKQILQEYCIYVCSENADNMQQQCHFNAVTRMLHIAALGIS